MGDLGIRHSRKKSETSDMLLSEDLEVGKHSKQPSMELKSADLTSIQDNGTPCSKIIIINCGGTRFETRVDTCTKFGTNTMLGAMLLSFKSEPKEEYFLDRDPEIFRHILNWYRTGWLQCPQGIHLQMMEKELEFYGIPKDQLRIFQKQFTLAGKKVWSCKSCGIHLADHRDISSKDFNGKNGKAYLFLSAVNVTDIEPVDKMLATGKHTVADITCNGCGCYLGWKYIKAFDEVNKYKEGSFILEKALIIKERNTY